MRLRTPYQRKVFFLREYQEMVKRMWRGEFVREKKKEIREEIRREFDKANETIDALEIGLKKLGSDDPTRENVVKTIESKKKDLEQFKQQIDSLDNEINEVNELLKGYDEGLDLLKELINE